MHALLSVADTCRRLDRDGFALLPGVFRRDRIATLLADLTVALTAQDEPDGSIRSRGDVVFAARNLLQVWPAALELACEPALQYVIQAVLGADCGLVRGLFFDKPPGQSWALPWHKDLTIAVRDNRLPSTHFTKPTVKAGVPHVEAPESILQSMLTARIHLDDVTDDNGPLRVVPGSHRLGKKAAASDAGIQTIHAAAGDVLMMRPLLSHSSLDCRDGTNRHRRIVHLEFAAVESLPDGYAWQEFARLREGGRS